MKKLIERVKALNDEYSCENAIAAIEYVVDLLEEATKPKNKPDSEGWWWIVINGIPNRCAYFEIEVGIDKKQIIHLPNNVPLWLFDGKNTKFIKVIVPESEG